MTIFVALSCSFSVALNGMVFLMSKTIIFSGYEESLMSSVTENTTHSVTTWGHPWPPQIHWLDPYLNLSSYSQEIIDGIVLGDKLKKEIRNYSHSLFGWIIDIRADGDLTDAHYNKYYANNTENMFICYPKFAQFMDKLYRPLTKLEIARCGNYTAGIWDWQKRQGQWKYMWKVLKYRIMGMFALAAAVSITGVFGEIVIVHEISMGCSCLNLCYFHPQILALLLLGHFIYVSLKCFWGILLKYQINIGSYPTIAKSVTRVWSNLPINR